MLLPSAGLSLKYVKLYSTGIKFYQPASQCLIQQDKNLPDQSRKGKRLSQSGISMVIQKANGHLMINLVPSNA